MLAEPGNEDYDYYHTYARSFHLLGNKSNAIAAQLKAIELGIKNKLDKNEMTDLKNALKRYQQ